MSLIDKVEYQVERIAEGSHSGGVYTPGTSSNFTIKGNLQPLSGNEILQLPEGDRQRQSLWLYSRTELKVNDIVTADGKSYEVQPVEDWTRQRRLPHYKARIMLKDI